MNLTPMPRFRVFLSLLLAAVCFSGSTFAADPAKTEAVAIDPLDWPFWRGPEMNGISREKDIVESWSPEGENLLWKSTEAATRSTPIVMNGKLYVLARDNPGTTKEGEKVLCLDAATGKKLWENVFNVFLSDVPDTRIGWSSVVGDPTTGNVYALGVCGLFQAIDGKTGKTLWSHSMSEEYGMLTTYGGRTNLPVVFEDQVIISGVMTGWGENAIPAHRFTSFDKTTGQAIWLTSTRVRPEDTTYSCPVFGVFNGEAAIVFGAGDGAVYALQPRTGKVIWKYEVSIRGINTTPLVAGNTIFCGHSEENLTDTTVVGAIFALDGSKVEMGKPKELWKTNEVTVGRSAPLLIGDRLYVVTDGATLQVHDAKTGKKIAQQKLGTIMMGSPIYADGKIFVGEATGRWWALEPTEKGVKVVHKLRLDNEELLGSPIVSHGRLYIPSVGALYCVGKKDQKPSADPQPAKPVELPAKDDPKPALVQVVPVESLIRPDQKQPIHVRLYNSKGRYLNNSPAEFTLKGPGKIEKDAFVATDVAKHAVTLITAKVGELTGNARVRIIPPLPWSFDFTDKLVPPTWIGARARYETREVDGNGVLVKVTTIPKGTRSQSWMGPTNLHDYTVQADVKGSTKNGKMPDVGLINQRYTLDLMGSSQQLQIRSWAPQLELRFAKTIPFAWKPDVWYTIKCQSENKGGTAVIRGKVWPKGEPEPEAWTTEAADETPNTTGSPGLFGNASDAEIFIDNVKVTPNTAPTAAK